MADKPSRPQAPLHTPPKAHHPPVPTAPSQDALTSVRLQHFNYLSPSAGGQVQQQQQQLPPRPPHDRRHYSFDTDYELTRFASNPAIMDYDQTEGLGGISVSSYESLDDDRSPIDPAIRAYPYHREKGVGYPLTEHIMPYSAPPIYPSVGYQIDELGHVPGNYTPSDVSSSISPPNGQIGSHKYSTVPPSDRLARALNAEESTRVAAEEDKRRRNTAASARFRVKKKQREQALERTVREASEVNAGLEARVAQLEMENRWLKNLLTEKNDNVTTRMAPPPPPENSAGMAASVAQASGPGDPKPILPKRDNGVGTDV